MKQTLEEAAREAAEDCYEMPYNENLINMRIIKEAFEFGAEWQGKQCKDAFFIFFRSHCKYAVTEFNCHMYREDVACCIENCDLFKQFTLGEG